jgi:hypothetical protein
MTNSYQNPISNPSTQVLIYCVGCATKLNPPNVVYNAAVTGAVTKPKRRFTNVSPMLTLVAMNAIIKDTTATASIFAQLSHPMPRRHAWVILLMARAIAARNFEF